MPEPQLETFIFTVTAIFLEAAPFVLLGSLPAASLKIFFSPERLSRIVPGSGILQTL